MGSLPPRFEGDYRWPMAPCRCVSLQWVATLAKDGQVCLVQIYAIALLTSISSLQNAKSLEVMYKPSCSGSRNAKMFTYEANVNDGIAFEQLEEALAI